MIELIILAGLIALVVTQRIEFIWERKRYLKLISELSDKVMSRNYEDYLMGKELAKEEEVTTRPRTDADEALIEGENLAELEEKAKRLGEQLDKAVYQEVG